MYYYEDGSYGGTAYHYGYEFGQTYPVVHLTLGLVALGCAIWVAFDSVQLRAERGRLGGGLLDQGPIAWSLSVLLVWLIAFPCYLLTRPRLVRAQHREQWERWQRPAYAPVNAHVLPPPFPYPVALQHYPPPQAPYPPGSFRPPT
ncbi:hypothetical protein ACIB24_19470 [Spongisporangium articulatum]|uniref:Uncharacterized protein n=1 Tax=Spongisporangium articulatum TaxID=3362603 RepID=A0ABW8AUF8_9ACTN